MWSKSMNEVIWKDVVGYEITNMVSSQGGTYVKDRKLKRTRAYGAKIHHQEYIRKGHELSPSYSVDGYLQLTTKNGAGSKSCVKVHRWVAEAFIPNPENKPQVNHINGIKDDNRVENLEWCTAKENVNHSYKTGLACNKGERHPKAKLTNTDILYIRERYLLGATQKELATFYGVCISTVSKIIARKYWRHL